MLALPEHSETGIELASSNFVLFINLFPYLKSLVKYWRFNFFLKLCSVFQTLTIMMNLWINAVTKSFEVQCFISKIPRNYFSFVYIYKNRCPLFKTLRPLFSVHSALTLILNRRGESTHLYLMFLFRHWIELDRQGGWVVLILWRISSGSRTYQRNNCCAACPLQRLTSSYLSRQVSIPKWKGTFVKPYKALAYV